MNNKLKRLLKYKIHADGGLATEIDAMLNAADGIVASDTNDESEENENENENENEDITTDEETIEDEDITDTEEDQDTDETEEDDEEENEEEEEETDEEPSEVSKLIEQNQILIKMLQDKSIEKSIKKKEAEPVIDPFESEQFTELVDTMEWDKKEVEAQKKFLGAMMTMMTSNTKTALLSEAPSLIKSEVSSQQKGNATRDSFYGDHPKLSSTKSLIKNIAKDVSADAPEGTSIEEVLAETAKQAYKILGITPDKKGKQGKVKAGKSKKPAFANQKGSKKKAAKKSKNQSDFDAMLALDND